MHVHYDRLSWPVVRWLVEFDARTHKIATREREES
jgi:hypothetical protein